MKVRAKTLIHSLSRHKYVCMFHLWYNQLGLNEKLEVFDIFDSEMFALMVRVSLLDNFKRFTTIILTLLKELLR